MEFSCRNKSRFASEADVNVAIKRLRKSHDGIIYRPYLCECGLWHISTKAAISDLELRRENVKLRERNESLKKDNNRLQGIVMVAKYILCGLLVRMIRGIWGMRVSGLFICVGLCTFIVIVSWMRGIYGGV